MKNVTNLLKFFAIIPLAMSLTYCSNDESAPLPKPANLDEFFATLPQWEEYSAPLSTSNGPIEEPIADTDFTYMDDYSGVKDSNDAPVELPYSCHSTSYSLTETPDKITTLNPDIEVLYVGSMLQGSGHLNGIGSLAELPLRQRAPLTVSLDLLTGNNNRVVESPDVSSVNQAIGEMINDAQVAGHTAGSNIYYTSRVAHSFVQASLEMGLSVNYMGANIQGSLGSDISEDKLTVTAYFAQQMFTAYMVLPQYPGDVFSDAFTDDILQQEIETNRMGPENPPVYVSSITYGRILMYSFTSTATEAKINATLNAVYNDGTGEFGGQMSVELQAIMENAEIEVVTVGGDAQHALDLIRSNHLGEFFSSDDPLSTAKPISYTIRNLKDNTIAKVSETTEYNLRECTEAEPTGALFNIRLTNVEALNTEGVDPLIDPFFYTPNEAEIYYEFYIEGGSIAPLTKAAYLPKETLITSLGVGLFPGMVVASHLCTLATGDNLELVNYDIDEGGIPTQAFKKVPLKKNGENRIRIHGTLWDLDVGPGGELLGDDPFEFNRVFSGEDYGGFIVDGNQHNFSIVGNNGGNQFKIWGTYQRTGFLYD